MFIVYRAKIWLDLGLTYHDNETRIMITDVSW
jgi:hypothetical protein